MHDPMLVPEACRKKRLPLNVMKDRVMTVVIASWNVPIDGGGRRPFSRWCLRRRLMLSA